MRKIFLMTLLLLMMAACGSKPDTDVSLDYKWKQVEEKSKGTQVNIYMYGGAQEVNRYMDQVVAKALKESNDISLNRVPLTDIKDTVNKLIVEKQAGQKRGSVDILWINGEKFKELKDNEVLWGNFTAGLPSMEYINPSTAETDFGERIEGLEAPWGESQFNFIYNGRGQVPFTDHKSLMTYVKAKPGRFTYPAVPDHTGSAFVRNMVLDILGAENVVNMTPEGLEASLPEVWSYFAELKPYLWRKGETYPEGEGKLDTLFKSGEVDVTMGYTINKVSSKIISGGYPKGSRSFLLDKGTLFNNHYLTIPENASNKWGALYAINYLLSVEGQLAKQNPENWGDFTVLDISKLDEETRVKLEAMSNQEEIPAFEELSEKRVGELTPRKLQIIEKGWLEYVGKN